ncbi:MAG: hypothetical protein JST06_02235 [Bacteroidetes bacterium]|nr:hypothetical protein [Bacteroidota bacterium]MBS1629352.1 hypothetical protein [Bacteroidota bacterium]
METRIINLPPERKDITPKDIMSMESFRHFTEEQAAELLQVVDSFCEIVYSIWSKQEKQQAIETQTISLTPQYQQIAA